MALLQDPCKSIIRRCLNRDEFESFPQTLEHHGFKLYKTEYFWNRIEDCPCVKSFYRNHVLSIEIQLIFNNHYE